MGCDIHALAEVRKNGKWQAVTDEVFPEVYYNPDSKSEYFHREFTADPYSGRNYFLFAMLADARNHHDLVPFSELKGVPDDASPEWLKEVDDWGGDMHSMSWYTLRELQEAPWDKTFTWVTLTTPEAAKKYQETGEWPDWTFRASTEPTKQISREMTYHEAAGFFYDKTLAALANLGDPDDVRLVFGFDN